MQGRGDEALRLLKSHGPQARGERKRHPGGLPVRERMVEELRASLARKVQAIRNMHGQPTGVAGLLRGYDADG